MLAPAIGSTHVAQSNAHHLPSLPLFLFVQGEFIQPGQNLEGILISVSHLFPSPTIEP